MSATMLGEWFLEAKQSTDFLAIRHDPEGTADIGRLQVTGWANQPEPAHAYPS